MFVSLSGYELRLVMLAIKGYARSCGRRATLAEEQQDFGKAKDDAEMQEELEDLYKRLCEGA